MSSISGDKLFLQGAFVGAPQCSGARSRLLSAGGGRLKSAAWKRLKVKRCWIYEVARRMMVAKRR